MITEIWKPATGTAYGLLVSNLGRVKRLQGETIYTRTTHGKPHIVKRSFSETILEPADNGHGYQVVAFNGKKHYVHRLVAGAFVDNPDNLKEVDHINGDRADNRAENLRWTTRTGNMANKLTKARNRKHSDDLKKPIVQLTTDGKLVREWESVTDAAKALGCARSTITAVVSPNSTRSKTALGYIFIYKSEYDPERKYNVRYAHTNSRYNEAISDDALVDLVDGEIVRYFPSMVSAAAFHGVSVHTIRVALYRLRRGLSVGQKKKSSFPPSLHQFKTLSKEQQQYVIDNHAALLVRP